MRLRIGDKVRDPDGCDAIVSGFVKVKAGCIWQTRVLLVYPSGAHLRWQPWRVVFVSREDKTP